jgi:hypothetical protein
MYTELPNENEYLLQAKRLLGPCANSIRPTLHIVLCELGLKAWFYSTEAPK